MCGITGIINSNQINKLRLKVLHHRGPDAEGLWSAPDGEMPVSLGHTRLAILDLSDNASQPMVSACNRYVLVFNGEIYNFLELREELQKRGCAFTSESDTEVFLQGLIHEGPSFQLKCNGMWAFCLWDRKEKTALLGRDRFGKKPLFYAHLKHGGMAFASEMKALYPFLETVQPSSRIEEHFRNLFDYEHTEDCVIQGIKRIPPGYWASWQNSNLKLYRWWNTLDHLEEPPAKYEEQVERWRELFLDAVRIRMRADVPIGTALSGGLDSSATFSTMAYLAGSGSIKRGARDWQHGFCAHYPGSSIDESLWARIVSDHIGVPLNEIVVNPVDGRWSIQEALYQVEDPYLTLPLPMLATYRAISDAGIKVTLDGHGADEMFSGYGHLRYAILNSSPEQFVELDAIDRSLRTGTFEPRRRFILLHWIAKQGYIRGGLKFLDLKRRMLGDWRRTFPDQEHPAFKAMSVFDQALYEIFHVTILPTLLRNYDRYSMASGVEIRMPFMDWRLVCFTFSLPWTSKLGGGYTKRVLRDAMAGILPEKVRTRRDKIGWNAPLHEWLKGPLADEVESLLARIGDERLLEHWRKFNRLKSPSYIEGEKMWKKLMPFFWHESLELSGNEGLV